MYNQNVNEINIEKLIDYKILPFDIYDENGEIIYGAGEILTTGKIMLLKSYDVIFRKNKKDNSKTSNKKSSTKEKQYEHTIEKNDHAIIETSTSPIDEINTENYIGPVNIDSIIDSTTQIKLKAFYSNIQKDIKTTTKQQTIKNYLDLKDKIYNDMTKQITNANFFSELKLLGEYTKCHSINVAILANAFGHKYGLENDKIQELILAGLLHDIGKKYLPESLTTKQLLTRSEKNKLKTHTLIGYEVIKNHLNLPERIANVALQHHEFTDGTGYPNKISEESIDLYSQIIGLCSYFDNLTFNKTEHTVKNAKDALKHIIKDCTKHYSSDILYTFIYMFSYNDIKNFEDMVM